MNKESCSDDDDCDNRGIEYCDFAAAAGEGLSKWCRLRGRGRCRSYDLARRELIILKKKTS